MYYEECKEMTSEPKIITYKKYDKIRKEIKELDIEDFKVNEIMNILYAEKIIKVVGNNNDD